MRSSILSQQYCIRLSTSECIKANINFNYSVLIKRVVKTKSDNHTHILLISNCQAFLLTTVHAKILCTLRRLALVETFYKNTSNSRSGIVRLFFFSYDYALMYNNYISKFCNWHYIFWAVLLYKLKIKFLMYFFPSDLFQSDIPLSYNVLVIILKIFYDSTFNLIVISKYIWVSITIYHICWDLLFSIKSFPE